MKIDSESIRKKVNIIDVISKYTNLEKWKWGKTGRFKHVGLCPFHDEGSPSFTVDEEYQLYHCFGCGEGGDVFSFIQEMEKMSFSEAVEYVKNLIKEKQDV